MKPKLETRLAVERYGKVKYHRKRDDQHAAKDIVWYQERGISAWVETRVVQPWVHR